MFFIAALTGRGFAIWIPDLLVVVFVRSHDVDAFPFVLARRGANGLKPATSKTVQRLSWMNAEDSKEDADSKTRQDYAAEHRCKRDVDSNIGMLTPQLRRSVTDAHFSSGLVQSSPRIAIASR